MSFHPHTPHVVLTASTDGLLCTNDAREPDEDESGIQVGNWGCSVNSVGWIDAGNGVGATTKPIWAHSDMQTVSLWSEEVRIQLTSACELLFVHLRGGLILLGVPVGSCE